MPAIRLAPDAVVLICEGHPLVAASMEGMLRDLGVQLVHVAAKITDAFAFAANAPPALAIVEWREDNPDTLALFRHLQAAAVPIIALTYLPASEMKRAGAVFSAMLEKPFTDAMLHRALREVDAM